MYLKYKNFLLTREQLKVIVNSLVVSCLDDCNGLFYGLTEKLLSQLQLIQNAAAKAVTGKYKHDHLENDIKELHWLDVRKRIIFKIGLLAYKSTKLLMVLCDNIIKVRSFKSYRNKYRGITINVRWLILFNRYNFYETDAFWVFAWKSLLYGNLECQLEVDSTAWDLPFERL